MDVTRSLLEQILGDLKRRKTFRLGDDERNHEYDDLDVFVGVDDAAVAGFSPADEGKAEAFVLWSRAGEQAFAADGALTRPLPIVWGGSRNAIQQAFARHGLTIRIEVDAEPRDGYDESGTLVLSPRSADETCDLRRLVVAFAELTERGVIALARAGMTQSAGWESVGERERDAQQTAVFWHDQSHDGFDALGQIGERLHLYWRGDEGLIAEVLTRAGFAVERPASQSVAIVIAGAKAPPPAIETYAAALQANPAAPPRRARKSRAPAGPFAELHRYRAPDGNKPVDRLAFDAGGTALAVAQVPDRRGGPQHKLCRIEAATGQVTRAFAPLSTFSATCGGCAFERWAAGVQLLRLLAGPAAGTRAAGGAPPGVGAGRRRGARAGRPSAVARQQRVAVERRRGRSACGAGDCDGRGHPRGRTARRGGVARGGAGRRRGSEAYPIAVLSPDARHVAWTTDGSEDARCVERAGVAVVWRANFYPGHRGGRSTRRLMFDPRGEHLLALCVRSLYGPERDGRVEVTEERRLQSYAVADGSRTHAALEAATLGLTCLAWHPDGERVALGTAEGDVVLVAYPGGERLAAQRVFAKGGTSALAFDREGARGRGQREGRDRGAGDRRCGRVSEDGPESMSFRTCFGGHVLGGMSEDEGRAEPQRARWRGRRS
ncbi:DUF6891 domain-containing protein [Nannocystis pusilla]|uniref:DUF6891 domain-containing protein n=1 Tax=Nannocystis pusilla TaxID=889268 RepID=UPI003B8165E1